MRFGLRSGFVAATALALACSGTAGATDFTIAGKINIIKPGKLAKMVAPGSYTIPAPGSAGDPLINGGNLDVVDTSDSSGLTTALPAGQWTGLGNPPGISGYKYKGAGVPGSDPCKIVLVKSSIIKFVCKDDEALDPPLGGNSAITLSLGADNYCAEFGGTPVKNDAIIFKRKDAPAPGACFTGPFACAGCNGHSFLNFSTVNAPGDCGDIIDAGGMVVANVNCAGLYTGGGGNSVPLPYAVPDLGSSVTRITTCTGSVATVGATTSVETGSNLDCAGPGCSFGAPLAVPNPNSTPTSVCVLNAGSAAPTGTVDCSTGATNITLPLSSVLFLTGDVATDPGSSIAGIQPCPLCQAGSCVGGPNNGMSCTAGTTAINSAYPTSHDCPPDPMFNIGTLPINFVLTSGSLTWTGTGATNDTGSTVGVQNRDFTGYCRDADGTGAFAGSSPATAQQCWENGMAVGPACSGTFETCEQRNNGAFGPNGGNNRTIVAVGNSMSIIGGPSAATLVSIFSIAPTFDPTVDAAGDLPGPGAVALPGTARSCASAAACP